MQKTHGGKRKGSGRKPVSDPKIQLSLYIPSSIIENLGGKQATISLLMNQLEKENKKNLKKT